MIDRVKMKDDGVSYIRVQLIWLESKSVFRSDVHVESGSAHKFFYIYFRAIDSDLGTTSLVRHIFWLSRK